MRCQIFLHYITNSFIVNRFMGVDNITIAADTGARRHRHEGHLSLLSVERTTTRRISRSVISILKINSISILIPFFPIISFQFLISIS